MKIATLGSTLAVGGFVYLMKKSPTTRRLLKPPLRAGIFGATSVIEMLGKRYLIRT